MSKDLLSVKHLMEALQAAGLPHTKVSVWEYERRGVIKAPKNFMDYGHRKHRLYTQAEISRAVEAVRKYRQSLTAGKETATS